MLALMVPRERLGEFAPLWKEGTERILARGANADDIEDAIRAIHDGAGRLIVLYETYDSYPCGFITVEPVVEDGDIIVHTSVGYARPNSPEDTLPFGFLQAEEFGKMIGADRVRFQTTRLGWHKAAKKIGAELTLATFEKRIE